MKCPRCDYGINVFSMPTDLLQGHMREVVDALCSHVAENPGAPAVLREAVLRLNNAAVNFTNTLYRE